MTYLEVISQTVLTSLINSLWCGIVLTAIVGVMLNRWHPNRGIQPARLNATTRFTIWWTTLLLVMLLPFCFILLPVDEDAEIGLSNSKVKLPVATEAEETPLSIVPFSPTSWPTARVVEEPTSTDILPAEAVRANVAVGSSDQANQKHNTANATISVSPIQSSIDKPFFPLYLSILIRNPQWTHALVLTWLAIAIALLIRLWQSYDQSLRLLKDAVLVTPKYQDQLDQMTAQVGINTSVRLYQSTQISQPMVVGLRQVAILMPKVVIAKLSRPELDLILQHEMIHLQRCHHWIQFIQRLAEAILFFHPAIWWINKQLDLNREVSCDDEIVAILKTEEKPPVLYAQCLTKLVELNMDNYYRATTLGIMHSRKQAPRRVELLLDKERQTDTHFSGWGWVVFSGLLLGLIGMTQTVAITLVEAKPLVKSTKSGLVENMPELLKPNDSSQSDELASVPISLPHNPSQNQATSVLTEPAPVETAGVEIAQVNITSVLNHMPVQVRSSKTEKQTERQKLSEQLGSGFIVWESNRSGEWRIWYQHLNGQGLKQLSPNKRERAHFCPHISPDGTKLIYLSYPRNKNPYDKHNQSFKATLHLLDLETLSNRQLVDNARSYFENRAVVWQDNEKFIFIKGDGHTYFYDLAQNRQQKLSAKRHGEFGWLIDAKRQHAVSGRPVFSSFDEGSGNIREQQKFGGCQPYFTHDGRWGFWMGGGGGPIRAVHLSDRRTKDILRKNDARMPGKRSYLYFPMYSRDNRAIAYGASPNQHDHHKGDYDIFVAPTNPDTLEIEGTPVRYTFHGGVDRFPDVHIQGLALGSAVGEAPFTVNYQLNPPPPKIDPIKTAVRWQLAFRQTVGKNQRLWKKGEWSRNTNNPKADNFSVLDQLEKYRQADGKFTFQMRWPKSGEQNTWRQKTNPVTRTEGGVDGYQAIQISHTDNRWGGLEHNTESSSLLDGSVDHRNWYYAIGTTTPWKDGLPAWSDPTDQVELYVGVELPLDEKNWQLVFRQTVGGRDGWWKKGQWSRNTDNPRADNFSILDQLEKYRQADGKFTFQMRWPNSGSRHINTWRQQSNPVTRTQGGVDGYREIQIAHSDHYWRGLEHNSGKESLLDGSVDHGHWYYAVGSTEVWQGGIPAWSEAVDLVELYVYQEKPEPKKKNSKAKKKQQWRWDFGDGSRETVDNRVTHVFRQAGKYQVTANAEGRQRRGAVTVLPAKPPQPLTTWLVDPNQIAVRFDEPIKTKSLNARLASGGKASRSQISADQHQLNLHFNKPITGKTWLDLKGVTDQAQIPNVMPKQRLSVAPASWPIHRSGLVFVWQNDNVANSVDGKICQPQADGMAHLDNQYAMQLAKGRFTADEWGQPIKQELTHSNQLTLEVVLKTNHLNQAGPARIVSFSSSASSRNFTLGQERDRLIFRLRTTKTDENGTRPETNLCAIEANQSVHIAVTYRSGNLICYRDGVEVLNTDQISGDFSNWSDQHLLFGDEWDGNRDWAGTLEGIAIYNRVLPSTEILKHATNYQHLLSTRPQPQLWKVKATAIQRSKVPTLAEISPYHQALMVYEYQVDQVLTDPPLNDKSQQKIRVVHWAILNTNSLKLPSIGQKREMVIEPFSQHPQLESLFLSDTLPLDFEAELYYATIGGLD